MRMSVSPKWTRGEGGKATTRVSWIKFGIDNSGLTGRGRVRAKADRSESEIGGASAGRTCEGAVSCSGGALCEEKMLGGFRVLTPGISFRLMS